ncbi:uncharacterized protein LOC118471800 [Amphiprion ocellaris]|uniref:uncharacterized protein LOC118471800 n=1 Tax=Amphiprion ocellaris TaxID=80972 RepID=UPI002410DE14|nr:uncharacterized protein LOC118471800 [Amphiprion ocellaris]
MLDGLGKRSLTIYENMTHSEFSELLVSAYPRLANICGGWMLHKSTGGGGWRSLVVIPPDLHGYTGQQLKAVSGNGRYTMYISPLQEELDTVPLPPKAKEFEKMPKAQCTTCKKMVPLQILPVHIKECKTELVDLSYSAEEENCNEEHEDEFPDSICNQTDPQIMTAMSQVDQYQSVKSVPFKAPPPSYEGPASGPPYPHRPVGERQDQERPERVWQPLLPHPPGRRGSAWPWSPPLPSDLATHRSTDIL